MVSPESMGTTVLRPCVVFDSRSNRDSLDADELQVLFGRTFYFKTQLDSLPNSLRDFVQGLRLCMTSGDLGD